MCRNELVYDLAMTAADVPRDFDSLQLCRALGIDASAYSVLFQRAKWMNGPKRPGTFVAQLNQEQTARFQENVSLFPGFQLVERNIRSYPGPSAGVMLGFIGEVSPAMLKNPRFSSYQQGDYAGVDGLELKYEEALRGQRGVYYFEKDNFNRPRDPYMKGALDTAAIAGHALNLYVDKDLQEYGEKLMQNKLGSIVAIDPSTGGILALVSSPGYDPNLLRGADRSRNFSDLYKMATKPLFNRAMKAMYPPGSTQKPMTALIALDNGAITPAFGYPCHGGYSACGHFIACTEKWAGHANNLRLALANSCNSYFCHVFRLTIDMKKWPNIRDGMHDWYEHMYSFGFGHPTGVDLPYEIGGTLFDAKDYDKMYRGSWNSCTNLFVGMGQGELAVTPIQMANGECIIANHGFYYTPHLVRAIDNNPNDPALKPYLVKHEVTHIPDSMYTIVSLGMQDVVEKGTARVAKIEGLDFSAKTGTAENKANVNGAVIKMQNHSMFVAFAPRVHPKIAIAVTVENAGYGATWAGPIASLMIEKYINDSISAKRKPMEDRMIHGNVVNKYVGILDSQERAKSAYREAVKIYNLRLQDSLTRANDSLLMQAYVDRYLRKKNK